MPEKSRFGTWHFEEGKFFLEVEGRREEVPVGVQDEAQLHELVGEQVEVLYAKPKPHVVGLVAKRHFCYWILCYYPPYPWWRYRQAIIPAVDEEVRVGLAKRFMEEGLIGEEVFERLVGS